jgi:hypothetical protein
MFMHTANAGPLPLRSIRWLRRPTAESPGILAITVRGNTNHYRLFPLACDIGGRGFRLDKEGTEDSYDVRLGASEECDCTCPGFTFRPDRVCKHVSGLLALVEAGEL